MRYGGEYTAVMTSVEIKYCVPCDHLDHAQTLQNALLSTFGQKLDSVTLVTEDGGTFEVRVDGELIFDVDEDEYDTDSIVETVGERV